MYEMKAKERSTELTAVVVYSAVVCKRRQIERNFGRDYRPRVRNCVNWFYWRGPQL